MANKTLDAFISAGKSVANWLGSSKSKDAINDITGAITGAAQAAAEASNYANSLSAASAAKQMMFQQQQVEQQMAYNAQEAQKNRDFQAQQNQIAMDYNAEQATINREWQEHMSNTAWQRGIQDMQAAGINPILAYSNGGANNGSGATATIGGTSGSQATGSAASGASYHAQTNQNAANLLMAASLISSLGSAASDIMGSMFNTGKETGGAFSGGSHKKGRGVSSLADAVGQELADRLT